MVVGLHRPNSCSDLSDENAMSDSEHAQSGACNDSDVDDAVKSSSPSHPRCRISRMLGWLTVRDKRHTPGEKRKPAQRCKSWSEYSRRVAIESSLSVLRSTSSHRRHASDSRGVVDNVQFDDRPIQHFATSLTSTDVRDGRFTARLPVDAMPHGDVMIRMRNGRLEVLQTELNEEHRAPRRLFGVIELPMYVDTDRVTVHHDALQQCLVIEATTKGYSRDGLRRRSLSLDDLQWPRSRRIAHDLSVRLMPTWKRREHDHPVILCSETRAVAASSDDTSHD